jgi:phosphoribosylglycinamide formyltransferase 1
MPMRVAVAVSGRGTNLEALLRALGPEAPARVVLVLSNRPDAPAEVIARYRGRILNVHPALLPAFGGQGMYGRRVHEAVLASGARESGATVHLVDEVYDRGAILGQARVPVLPGDDPESLAARVLEAEHRLLPAAVLAAAAAGHPVPISEFVESNP